MLSPGQEAQASGVMLPSVVNFRDVAGPGYLTPDGPMRRGLLFRSNTFLPSAEDVESVRSWGIVAIHDLRARGEVEKTPDAHLPGAVWRHSEVQGLRSETIRELGTGEELREVMINHWRGFVNDPDKRGGFATLFSRIADEQAPQIFHCAGGKDRTGWAAALIQRLVGVSDEDVVADFMITNERESARGMEVARMFFKDKPDDFLMPAMRADLVYLEAVADQMDTDYGDLLGYLRQGLNLSEEQIGRLRDRFRTESG